MVNDAKSDEGTSHSVRTRSQDDLMDDFLNSMREYEKGTTSSDQSLESLDHLVGAGSSSSACDELGNAQQAFAGPFYMGGGQPMGPP